MLTSCDIFCLSIILYFLKNCKTFTNCKIQLKTFPFLVYTKISLQYFLVGGVKQVFRIFVLLEIREPLCSACFIIHKHNKNHTVIKTGGSEHGNPCVTSRSNVAWRVLRTAVDLLCCVSCWGSNNYKSKNNFLFFPNNLFSTLRFYYPHSI